MNNKNKMPAYLRDKQIEYMYSLAVQDYTPSQIQMLFGFEHLSTVVRILEKMPKGWKSPWIKRKQVC